MSTPSLLSPLTGFGHLVRLRDPLLLVPLSRAGQALVPCKTQKLGPVMRPKSLPPFAVTRQFTGTLHIAQLICSPPQVHQGSPTSLPKSILSTGDLASKTLQGHGRRVKYDEQKQLRRTEVHSTIGHNLKMNALLQMDLD
ncbi:hypothetical protein VFPPC_16472 [Pochonia chlamydosporia 170]|uniref:Uncharacterized protein n=1 Tax=Pochonia chlamydosporia 170 TaxID=1380566 RepID=A0A179FDM6_METCM|nr:hypothetical protein VFPPC_16472 [Pochonia chlamydosporia 170]OAQ63410.1 hypothetical protein VFPPC_16472 [Pochonia chlamydosporia 170]